MDEDWYIPYHGPYEAPREPLRNARDRDSWGDPVYNADDGGAILGDQELHVRYGDHGQQHHQSEHGRWSSGVDAGDGRKVQGGRDRAQSALSGRTVSSAVIDPGRTSTGAVRRSTVSSGTRPVTSYINLDAAGGVGESPMPPVTLRGSGARDGNGPARTSLSSIFAFGNSTRKVGSPSRSTRRSKTPLFMQPSRPDSTVLRRSQSSELARNNSGSRKKQNNPRLRPQENEQRASVTTDDEDYYNSYYTTLLNSPDGNYPSHHQRNLTRSPNSSHTNPSPHPYAYPFPVSEPPTTPQTAPPNPVSAKTRFITTSTARHTPEPPRVILTEPLNHTHSTGTPTSQLRLRRPTAPSSNEPHRLKSSVSTPNLRTPSASPPFRAVLRKPLPLIPKGRERWLSPETWCDALLFPRPRLRIKQANDIGWGGRGSRGHIVSPPASPVEREPFGTQSGGSARDHGAMVSRVLAHSRSLVDLTQTTDMLPSGVAGPFMAPLHTKPVRREVVGLGLGDGILSRPLPETPVEGGEGSPGLSVTLSEWPLRPKSFAWDDLALPSPVPSLSQVLEEGEILQHQRRKWQMQATTSFQNKRARSLSRSRSKSLSKQGKRKDEDEHHLHSNFDFLAVRSIIGNLDPVVVKDPLPPRSRSATTGSRSSHSRTHSHSQTHSLSKTLSKSNSHSRGHSRNDSWSRSALGLAKSAMCGLNGDDIVLTPAEEKGEGLEDLVGEKEREDVVPYDRASALGVISRDNSRNGVSPTPSGVSYSKVGIALSTPPLQEDSLDRESIRLPTHPYAQGGAYSYVGRPEKGSDYAGPHPSARVVRSTSPDNMDVSARHRLPPQATLYPIAHPYAFATPRESYSNDGRIVPLLRVDSDIPPPAKMWAQFSPGVVVREVLPTEIQYSPNIPEKKVEAGSSSRNSKSIFDTAGVGEALAYAVRPKMSHDSGLGTSEGHILVSDANPVQKQKRDMVHVVAESSTAAQAGIHNYRKPVQYDASRPSHQQPTIKIPISHDDTQVEPVSSPLIKVSESPGSETGQVVTKPSPTHTSEASSPQLSPRPLGSVDDLDNFHDLFFRPNMGKDTSLEHISGSISGGPGVPWDISPRSRRTGSGLTSLARQLTEELEQMNLDRDRSSSYSSGLTPEMGRMSRRPTEGSLQFVFEDMPRPASPESMSLREHDGIIAFKPSAHLPEDIESSASSLMERTEEDGGTEQFRLGVVEAATTPITESSNHRGSLTGQMIFTHEQKHHRSDEPNTAHSHLSHSELRPSTADRLRGSYMTTSSSGMSGLSDFPEPPIATPSHLSLISSYFDDVPGNSGSRDSPPPLPPSVSRRRMTFGGDEDFEEKVGTASAIASPLASPTITRRMSLGEDETLEDTMSTLLSHA